MSQASNPKVRVGDKKEESSEKKLKPCCACPETKKARDEWYVKSAVTVIVRPRSHGTFLFRNCLSKYKSREYCTIYSTQEETKDAGVYTSVSASIY